MNVMSASCRSCALIFAALWIAGCASPSGSAVPGQAGDETRRGVHPDRVTVTFYTGAPEGAPYGITTGPDDALWYTAMAASYDQGLVGRITTAGQYTMQVDLGVGIFESDGITTGPDNNLWFTAYERSGAGLIGRLTTGGTLTLFNDTGGSDRPRGITTGPDGALWFAESNGTVGRITTSGAVEHFTVGSSTAEFESIVTGPDSNLWITEPLDSTYGAADKVYRLTRHGQVTSFTVAKGPTFICVGHDRALWFTEFDFSQANAIGRLTTKGAFTQFAVSGETGLSGIAAAPGGALWFTNRFSPFGVGRITLSGQIRLFRTRTKGDDPELYEITAGPDGNMWFTSISDPTAVGRVTI